MLATPVNPDPSPTKLDAVIIPENVALPLAAMVAAVPTFTAVIVMVGLPVSYTHLTLPTKRIV